MKKEIVYVYKGDNGSYSCCINRYAKLPYGAIGEGNTFKEAITEYKTVARTMEDRHIEDNQTSTRVSFIFLYHIPSFLRYYLKKAIETICKVI